MSDDTIISMPSTADAIQQLVAGLADAYAGSTDQGGYFDKQQPGQIRLASPQALVIVGSDRARGGMADAPDLGSGALRRGGSSPLTRIYHEF